MIQNIMQALQIVTECYGSVTELLQKIDFAHH